jgi:Poly(ADP-ribose) polymerase catalytic domain
MFMIQDESTETDGGLCNDCSCRGRLFSIHDRRIDKFDEYIHRIRSQYEFHIVGSLASGSVAFHFPSLTLNIFYGRDATPMLTHRIENKTLSRQWVDDLRANLRKTWHPLSIHLRTAMDVWILILQMLEHVSGALDMLRFPDRDQKLARMQRESDVAPLVDTESVQDVLSNFIGLKPNAFLDQIIQQTANQGRSYGLKRVVHCEVITRSDLTSRFLKARTLLEAKLQKLDLSSLQSSVPPHERRGTSDPAKLKAHLIEYLCKPRLTYHGTQAASVPSIVQHGFLKPGSIRPSTGNLVGVRCGSSHGRGIYTSPDPFYSFSYCTPDDGETSRAIAGSKLIVCLTLMGRSVKVLAQDDVRDATRAIKNADSHVSVNGMEYIVFDNAAVLPCYVVHLDWGEKRTREIAAQNIEAGRRNRRLERKSQQDGMALSMLAGDRKRAKAERLAQASKYFSYGYGPVKGNKIIVEDMAEVSDDEEDYGDYQQLRIDVDEEAKAYWDWDVPGASEIDQYRKARLDKSRRVSPD